MSSSHWTKAQCARLFTIETYSRAALWAIAIAFIKVKQIFPRPRLCCVDTVDNDRPVPVSAVMQGYACPAHDLWKALKPIKPISDTCWFCVWVWGTSTGPGPGTASWRSLINFSPSASTLSSPSCGSDDRCQSRHSPEQWPSTIHHQRGWSWEAVSDAIGICGLILFGGPALAELFPIFRILYLNT